MAADPYGEGTDETVNEARRRAQMEALQPSEDDDALRRSMESAGGGASGGGMQEMQQIQNAPPPMAAPTEERRGPIGGGGGGAPAPRPQFQPPQSGFMLGGNYPEQGGGGGGAPAAPTTTRPAITDQVTALLQKRLAELSNPLDVESDPIFQQQRKAFNVQSQRDAQRQRSQLAERRAAGGNLASGGFNTGVRSIEEQRGRSTQEYNANLAGERLQQREAQLNQAIQYARAVGQDDIAEQLENQKIALAKEGLALQRQLGLGDLALREKQSSGQLGLGYDQLGLNYAQLQNLMNNQAVMAALGGS